MNNITETDFLNLLTHAFHPKETLKNVKSLANNHPKFREAYVILVKNFLDSVEEAVKDLKNKNCEEIHKKICKIKPAVSKMPDEIKSYFLDYLTGSAANIIKEQNMKKELERAVQFINEND